MKTEHENLIGKRMKELRGLMSQRQAAACVGIKPQGWNVYESGQSLPGAQVIKNICQYFNVSADWLLCLETRREPSKATVPNRASKTLPPLAARSDAAVLAELEALKRRVGALEDAAGSPSFACG